MHCVIPLLLGFVAGKSCDFNRRCCFCGGRECCCRIEKHLSKTATVDDTNKKIVIILAKV